MKRLAASIAATFLFSTLNADLVDANADASPAPFSQLAATNDHLTIYVGSNARWLVDRRHGVVAAWELNRNRPLWSPDGVVFRFFLRPNNVISDFNAAASRPSLHAPEIFGRVYFCLPAAPSLVGEPTRPDALLVALDVRSQGRVVWTRRADDFTPFFPPPAPSNAASTFHFVPASLVPLPNDELRIQVRRDNEIQSFAINAADGATRLLGSNVDAN